MKLFARVSERHNEERVDVRHIQRSKCASRAAG